MFLNTLHRILQASTTLENAQSYGLRTYIKLTLRKFHYYAEVQNKTKNQIKSDSKNLN